MDNILIEQATVAAEFIKQFFNFNTHQIIYSRLSFKFLCQFFSSSFVFVISIAKIFLLFYNLSIIEIFLLNIMNFCFLNDD